MCNLLSDTHSVMALADEGLLVVLSLRPHRDQLKRVGPCTELTVRRLHPVTCAVCKVDPANWVLRQTDEQTNKHTHTRIKLDFLGKT